MNMTRILASDWPVRRHPSEAFSGRVGFVMVVTVMTHIICGDISQFVKQIAVARGHVTQWVSAAALQHRLPITSI